MTNKNETVAYLENCIVTMSDWLYHQNKDGLVDLSLKLDRIEQKVDKLLSSQDEALKNIDK